MHGDYGYMEEGGLGKPYDIALLKKLLVFALPYKKIIALALLASMGVTLLSLCGPYLEKVAIDRFIVAQWRGMQASAPQVRQALARSGVRHETAPQARLVFIRQSLLKKMDPRGVHALEAAGLMSPSPWLRVRLTPQTLPIVRSLGQGAVRMPDQTAFVQKAVFDKLGQKQKAALRADGLRGALSVGLALMCIVALSFWLGFWELNLLERAGQYMMADIRMRLFDHLQSQSLAFFDKNPVGKLVTRLTNDIENLNEMFKSVMVTVFKDVFILAGIVCVLLYLDVRLALVCFALIPPVFAVTMLFSAQARDAFRDIRQSVSKINAFCQERFSAMQTVQLFGVQASDNARFGGINEQNYEAGMRQIHVFAIFMPLMELLASLGLAVLIWYGGGQVLRDRVSLGTLVAFVSYLRMFFQPIRDIAEKYNIMQAAMASTERIFEYLDQDRSLPRPSGPRAPDKITGHVCFENVSFSYSGGPEILSDVSFEIRPGQMVALAGKTGAGKTTAAHLVERFYDPVKGRILFDGVDLRDWPEQALRQNIGLVQQDVFLFSGTIRDNITLGKTAPSDAAILEAVQKAGAGPLVARLADGLDHKISERGANISAGERQLLSFARALFFDPVLLILDEATSSVDPETERRIQEAIFVLSRQRTTLVVAHRLATIEHADMIVVLAKGRIQEAGTHAQLMGKKGAYYRLRNLLAH